MVPKLKWKVYNIDCVVIYHKSSKMKPYETAVKNPVGTSLIFIGLVLIGLIFYFQLPIDLLPDIEMNVISVMTYYPGAGADDVETNVTRRWKIFLTLQKI